MDDHQYETASTVAAGTLPRTQTIVSGMFLSLAFVFGGLWFVRSGKAATKTGKGVVVLAVSLGIASSTLLFANIAPPVILRSITGKIFSVQMQRSRVAWGEIKLELSDSDQVELIIPNPKETPAE
jgi:hypothetical protein